MDLEDTIVAIATPAGGAARGALRISGPQALAIARKLAGSDDNLPSDLKCSTACGVELVLGRERTLPATYFVWPSTRSYTRQPTVEIHTLGSPPLLQRVLSLACDAGARLALAGEFTLRAFLAGRIDLTQAEAVLGVIDAGGEHALQTALKQLAGGLAAPLAELREELLLLLADLEAGLDFADEDIEFIASEVLSGRLEHVAHAIESLVQQVAERGVAGDLPRVVLAGSVNVGKSSLFNAMLRRYGVRDDSAPAIESPEPGATRDYLLGEVQLGAVRCVLVDTAGVESVSDSASPRAVAQSMADSAREAAALVLCCREAASKDAFIPAHSDTQLVVTTKVDLAQAGNPIRDSEAITTSATTGFGLDLLAETVAERLGRAGPDLVSSTAERSRGSLQAALDAINEARQLVSFGDSEELVATELRIALDALGQIAGVVHNEDVLDRVFSRFCIGK